MQGARIIFLMRTTMIPFSVMSYLLGLTSVRFKHFFIGSCAIMIHVMIWLYLGSTFTYLDLDTDNPNSTATPRPPKTPKTLIEKMTIVIQVFIGIGIMVYISYLARKELNKRLNANDGEAGSHHHSEEMHARSITHHKFTINVEQHQQHHTVVKGKVLQSKLA